MKAEQITEEWMGNLSRSEIEIVMSLQNETDFLVMGEAMPFIEEVASACGYNIVYVKLQTREDLLGTAVVKHNERLGLNYFDYDVKWMNAVESSQKKSLVIFNVDDADNRLVNGIKSFVERHGDKYFVGLICTDNNRDLKHTTTYALVGPAIHYNC